MATLVRERRRLFVGNKFLFIANLTISDLLFGVVMIYNMVTVFYAELSYAGCLSLFMLIEFALRLSNLSLVLIAVDQYVTIAYALRSGDILTPTRVWGALAALWATLVVVALLPAAGWRARGNTRCLLLKVHSPSYLLTFDVLLFYAPAVVMTTMYARIFAIARRHLREIAAQELVAADAGVASRARSIRREVKMSVTIVIVIVAFVASWAPMIVIRDVESAWPDTYRSTDVFLPYTIAACNSFYNPFIYV
ncbi:PREDICTED: adenosine receptor A2a-like, partial [Priapulus caudatus]|uniref:Adenosine receptor A2a-like n=1 Tax=Priapulus caudatus TaxID=37621 RepID=A0ABM1F0Q1_PRICU